MTEESVAIGTVSFFVNAPKDSDPTRHDMQEVGAQVSGLFGELLSADPETSGKVRIDSVEARRGCIIVAINIVLVAKAAGIGGAIWAVKDYAKIRESIVRLAKDLQKAYVTVERWARPYRVWFYRDDMIVYDRRLDGGYDLRFPNEAPVPQAAPRLTEDDGG